MKHRVCVAMAIAGAMTTMAGAQTPAPQPPIPQPDPTIPPVADYAQTASWECRPGGSDDGTCSAGLDALKVDGKGGPRTPAGYAAAKAPPVDCFYIYPTASSDPGMYSDLVPDQGEKGAIHNQAARLGSVCRLFVPLYHQFTGTGLRYALSQPTRATGDLGGLFDAPYRDVVAAWRDYMKRNNEGRGVILVGHSQGAILLKRLIAEEIDGKPAQKRLVGAYLAGNPDLTTDSFKSIKPCATIGETGCVVAWSSYREGEPGAHFFGAAAKGKTALCVNPAAPGGGRGMLDSYLSRPAMAPASDPPFVEAVNQLSAECVTDKFGTTLRIRVEPSPYADLMRGALDRYSSRVPGWGLHTLDVNLVQGNMLTMIAAQTKAWRK